MWNLVHPNTCNLARSTRTNIKGVGVGLHYIATFYKCAAGEIFAVPECKCVELYSKNQLFQRKCDHFVQQKIALDPAKS